MDHYEWQLLLFICACMYVCIFKVTWLSITTLSVSHLCQHWSTWRPHHPVSACCPSTGPRRSSPQVFLPKPHLSYTLSEASKHSSPLGYLSASGLSFHLDWKLWPKAQHGNQRSAAPEPSPGPHGFTESTGGMITFLDADVL